MLNWTPGLLYVFRSVSEGRLTVKKAIRKLRLTEDPYLYDFMSELLSIVYDSKKPITFIDIPYGDPLAEEFNKYKAFRINFDRDFEKTLDGARDFLRNHSAVQKKREEYMIHGLTARIEELLKIYPELNDKDKLKILLTIGALHTPLYFDSKAETPEIRREFKSNPLVFGFQEEGLRRERFGKGVDDEFIARVLLEQIFDEIFRPFLAPVIKDSLKLSNFLRSSVSEFNFNEIKQIYYEIKKAKNGAELLGMFKGWFREKNIKLPSPEK